MTWDPLLFAWVVAFAATVWLLLLGFMRVLAHKAGDIDRTPGMVKLGRITLGAGGVALLVLLVLTGLIVLG